MVINHCLNCDAKCCKYIALELDFPENKNDIEDLKWYILHQNVEIYIDHDDDLILEFKTKCKALDKNNQCKIYSKRPSICRKHNAKDCENNEGKSFKVLFKTPEDIENYFKKEI